MASSFVTVGQNGFHLTDLVPANYGDTCLGDIYIELLDEFGTAQTTYSWYKGGSGKFITDGWYNGRTLIAKGDENDHLFERGEGLWLTGVANATLTFSGEVNLADITIPLIAGSKMIANPFPSSIKLVRDVTPLNYGDTCLGDIYIELLDEFGTAQTTYSWYKGGSGKFLTDGWYNGRTLITIDSDVEIAKSGDGLWVTGVAGASIKITCPTELNGIK